jgi:hypothetical protein
MNKQRYSNGAKRTYQVRMVYPTWFPQGPKVHDTFLRDSIVYRWTGNQWVADNLAVHIHYGVK